MEMKQIMNAYLHFQLEKKSKPRLEYIMTMWTSLLGTYVIYLLGYYMFDIEYKPLCIFERNI